MVQRRHQKTEKYDLSRQNLPLATPFLPVKWGWGYIRWPILAQTHPTLRVVPSSLFDIMGIRARRRAMQESSFGRSYLEKDAIRGI